MKTLIVASKNTGKAGEIAAVLGELGDWVVKPLPEDVPDVEETGKTFLENAVLKAEYYSCVTDSLSVADDSGLIVDTLDGRPGLYSSRFAPTDEARNQKILEELDGVPKGKRTAHFVCALALARSGRTLWRGEGRVDGEIVLTPTGENGFGYDPIFWVPEFGCTMGQLSPQVKNQISHRGLALAKLKQYLESHGNLAT
jgi:non-canonical purine NTP pyrophosphatase (RdgB/HAM1 family)